MKRGILLSLVLFAGCMKSVKDADILPPVPPGAQAISLLGDTLYAADPGLGVLGNLRKAMLAFQDDYHNPDKLIWYGRRTAYTGDFREAIRIYSMGLLQFPQDARIWRHRGHRYISIREFDRAIDDFKKAVSLIQGQEDEIEPDGIPNAQDTPVSSLHTNIWYHLGLAYFLKGDYENALRAYESGVDACANDDMRVAFTHWLYMTLRRLGRDDDALAALDPIHPQMNIIENQAYHRLCLFYKGGIPMDSLTGGDDSAIMNDAAAYGVGNWFLCQEDTARARRVFERILSGDVWASFGFIGAEADWKREFAQTAAQKKTV